jgi:hypothetical protein
MSLKNNVINNYLEITKECPINQLGPPFTYYHADNLQTNLLSYNLINIDIKNAFPTICKILFGKDHPFVKNIYNIEEKKPRLIYLTTTLTELTKKNNYPYLNELNLWSKILILSYAYSKYENINILEYVKDGLFIYTSSKREENKYSIFLNELINEHEITFHEKKVDIYCRFNKTSIYKYENELVIKGKYHNMPNYLKDIIIELMNGKIYDKILLNQLNYIYSIEMFNFCYYGGLKNEIDYYYKFDKSNYLSINYKLESIDKINTRSYLTEIIFPILALLRSSSNN